MCSNAEFISCLIRIDEHPSASRFEHLYRRLVIVGQTLIVRERTEHKVAKLLVEMQDIQRFERLSICASPDFIGALQFQFQSVESHIRT